MSDIRVHKDTKRTPGRYVSAAERHTVVLQVRIDPLQAHRIRALSRLSGLTLSDLLIEGADAVEGELERL